MSVQCIMVFAVLAAATAAAPVAAQVPVEIPEQVRFEGYEGIPEALVPSRKDELFFYPCGQCHDSMEPDPTIRVLSQAPHHETIEHGRGRIWCTSCHALEDRNNLVTLLDEPVDFDQSHLVCGGCHSARHKDWLFGAHGKRLDNWQGQRVIQGCPACHDPHDPAIKPREPEPPPPVRAGLQLEAGESHGKPALWERGDSDHGH